MSPMDVIFQAIKKLVFAFPMGSDSASFTNVTYCDSL